MNANGQPTQAWIEYGRTAAYGSQTTAQNAGPGTSAVTISARLAGLASGTVYHYRLVAQSAGGIATGGDAQFATLASPQQTAASRAVATYRAMQQYFFAGDGSGLYTGGCGAGSGSYSYLWNFSRALAGTITLSGIPSSLVDGASYASDVDARMSALAHYWDGTGYESCPLGPYSVGGDRYYDDQAWVGLALSADYQLRGTPTSLTQARAVFNYVYPGGWGAGARVDPGGIYWVAQGAGTGATNHDRTTTSNAPNAELGFQLERLDAAHGAGYAAGAHAMYGWVNHYLYNVNTNPTDSSGPNPNYDASQPALVFDKVRGGGTIDKTHWTYNQGAMIAANVAAFRSTNTAAYLTDAEAIATAALNIFTESDYLDTQPAAFTAIFFRDLLQLYAVTHNSTLQARIMQTVTTYADDAWNSYRASNGLFHLPSSTGTGGHLLDQGALLQIYAALAWDPSRYAELP